ncbi:MAG: HypC/HybG/HupF family hydrogenase formation chaperone [Micromonosporaceae bacterium]
MCVGEAAQVLSVEGDEVALVALHRGPRRVPLVAVTAAGETVAPGDWLLVQTGLAVARISAAEAADRNAYRGLDRA